MRDYRSRFPRQKNYCEPLAKRKKDGCIESRPPFWIAAKELRVQQNLARAEPEKKNRVPRPAAGDPGYFETFNLTKRYYRSPYKETPERRERGITEEASSKYQKSVDQSVSINNHLISNSHLVEISQINLNSELINTKNIQKSLKIQEKKLSKLRFFNFLKTKTKKKLAAISAQLAVSEKKLAGLKNEYTAMKTEMHEVRIKLNNSTEATAEWKKKHLDSSEQFRLAQARLLTAKGLALKAFHNRVASENKLDRLVNKMDMLKFSIAGVRVGAEARATIQDGVGLIIVKCMDSIEKTLDPEMLRGLQSRAEAVIEDFVTIQNPRQN